MVTVQKISTAIQSLLELAEGERASRQHLANNGCSGGGPDVEAAQAVIDSGKELVAKLQALAHDPIDLLARVLKASDDGYIKGLYGPLHGAICKVVESSTTSGELPQDAAENPYLLTVRRRGVCTSWVFETQSALDAAIAAAGRPGVEILYSTQNDGKGDLVSDASEFEGWLDLPQGDVAPSDVEYRLVVVHGDVEPVLQAQVYPNYAELVDAARRYRQQDDQDLRDGLYGVRVPYGSEVEVMAFSGGELEPQEG